MHISRIAILAFLLGACGATPVSVAQTPGAFDGTWQLQGGRTADPVCSLFVWRTLAVKNSAMGGTLGHFRGGFNLQGQVASDGKATFYGDGPYSYLVRGTGQFTGNSGSGNIRLTGADTFCDVSWTATRQN